MGMTEEDRRRLKGNAASVERLAVKPLEAALMLGESRSTIYRLINAGKLIARKSGASTLITVESVYNYLATLPAFEPRAAVAARRERDAIEGPRANRLSRCPERDAERTVTTA